MCCKPRSRLILFWLASSLSLPSRLFAFQSMTLKLSSIACDMNKSHRFLVTIAIAEHLAW
jgi:hypothetical protein